MAQEYASNGDLYQLITTKKYLTDRYVRFIIKSIALGLSYAHKHGCDGGGISHRDIKLENILIMDDGTIKIGDWGLSTFDIHNRMCSSSCGTLGYMAPELICRKKYKADKADVWSLGVMLFILRFGIRPYSEPKKRKQNKEDNAWCDEWLKTIKRGKWDIWWYSHIQCMKSSDEIRTKMKDKIDISDSYKNLFNY